MIAIEKKYKTYRNKLTKTLRAAEKDYYIKKFDAATHDMKKTWQLLKRILTANKSENVPVSFKSNNMIITDKEKNCKQV